MVGLETTILIQSFSDRLSVNMATAPSKKRKHTAHSLEFRMNVLKEVDLNVLKKKEICEKHNIAASTLSTFIKNRSKIEEDYYATSSLCRVVDQT